MIVNDDCFNYISNIPNKSIDLILVDPPYLISKKSGFTRYSDGANSDMIVKYGKVSIDFGEWDKEEIDWDLLFKEYHRVLKDGGTIIFFFDIWKAGMIKDIAESHKFKQARIGQWHKNNPVPINSKINYLSNAIEFFFSFVKDKKPTFNSEYDNGVYKYPLCHGKERLEHPTQKPLGLISELILKHSNPGDLVLDTFAGSGTTGHACILNDRKYILIERDEKYFEILKKRIDGLSTNIESNNI
jgi:site-specific DNA-methyltransferase (adenine-specific)